MDEDEDDGLFISGFGNRNAKPFREKTSKKHGFIFHLVRSLRRFSRRSWYKILFFDWLID